jgi:vacuolar iron transporter family protein
MSGPHARELLRLWRNWQAERDSAVLYAAFAQLEQDPRQRHLYEELTRAEERHAAFWEERLRRAGQSIPAHRPTLRTVVLTWLARTIGVGFVVPSVIAREMRDQDHYVDEEDAHAAGLAHEEHGHAAALRLGSDGSIGNNLRAAVLGANDGLSSNFCVMMGVAGAGASAATVLLAGIAGLVGGACSMALGEWLSVTNARELALSQLDREVGSTAHNELDQSVVSAGHAGAAACFSGLLFAFGALVPLLPFCGLPTAARIPGSVALSVVALFSLGVATSLFNARSAWFSGARQVVIGAAAAVITYVAGRVFALLTGI